MKPDNFFTLEELDQRNIKTSQIAWCIPLFDLVGEVERYYTNECWEKVEEFVRMILGKEWCGYLIRKVEVIGKHQLARPEFQDQFTINPIDHSEHLCFS